MVRVSPSPRKNAANIPKPPSPMSNTPRLAISHVQMYACPMPSLIITPHTLSSDGEVIASLNGEFIPVLFAIPGETVEVEVREGNKGVKSTTLNRVIHPSPHRVEPPCPYFGECGGCQWQHVAYSRQLEMKRDILIRQLREVGRIEDPYVLETIPSPSTTAYRNHARFSVNRQGSLGFTRTGTRRHLEIDRCLLMHDRINSVLTEVQGRGRTLRQVAVRCGVATGEMLVQPHLDIPGLTFESGQTQYTEALFGYPFRVSSPSFFQVNTPQAERMASELRDRLHPTGGELLADAYGGVGTFAVLLSPYYREIITLEESPSAIEDAIINCRPFPNVRVVKGKSEDVLPSLDSRPDTVILDPPRTGCHPTVLEFLANLAPRKIAYVSCAPNTLARDLRILIHGGYSLREAVPIDMFPQTHHVESISILERS